MTIKEFTSIMTTKPSLKLTHEGALKALNAAIAKAQEIGVPQNITIVDDGGNLLAFVRMDGASSCRSRRRSLRRFPPRRTGWRRAGFRRRWK